jgi:hypothetical protein
MGRAAGRGHELQEGGDVGVIGAASLRRRTNPGPDPTAAPDRLVEHDVACVLQHLEVLAEHGVGDAEHLSDRRELHRLRHGERRHDAQAVRCVHDLVERGSGHRLPRRVARSSRS